MRASPDFSVRSPRLELMDDPAAPAAQMRRALGELDVINRWLGGLASSIDGVARLLPARRRSFSLLDVGTGGGDAPRALAAWARRRGLKCAIEGIDLSADCVAHARAASLSYPELSFAIRDLHAEAPAPAYDVVHAALVLHHFPGQDAVAALRRMWQLCRLGVVVNDLHRHPAAYWSISALTAALSRSAMVRHDAPLSVLRGFTRDGLEDLAARAGLPKPEIRWRWAFRWQMLFRK